MAMQTASLGATRIVILVGAGLVGSVVVKNSSVTDFLFDLSKVLSKHLKEDGDKNEAGGDTAAALTAQVRRLSQELQRLASSSRTVTVVNSGSNSGTSIMSLCVPAAVVGAAGYSYMWWRGFSVGDIMYVTRKSMNNAVAGMGKQLEHVSAALSSTKRHLNQRLDSVTSKVDESVILTGLIKNQVEDVRVEVERSVFEIEGVQRQIEGLEGKIDEVQGSQNFANQGIFLLIDWVRRLQSPTQNSELVETINMWIKEAHLLEGSSSSPAAITSSGLKELSLFSQVFDNKALATADNKPMKSSSESRSGLSIAGDSTPMSGVARTSSGSVMSRWSLRRGLAEVAGNRGGFG